MIKDYNDSYIPDGIWINAINAVTNSHKGDSGTVGNEPSNYFCFEAPYTVIGIVRRDSDNWIVFSTNDVLSEIGIFTESTCGYKKVIQDACLGFDRSHLITGYAQYNFDCTWSVFFADGLNPDRTINLDNPPYQYTWDRTNPDCPTQIFSDCLDCEQTRLSYLVDPPCFTLTKSTGAGSLLNGSYQATIAYSINGQRVTNYFTPSNIMSMWEHIGIAGGIQVDISSIDTRFEEYELVIISTVAAQTVATKIGNYSTNQTTVYIDNYSEALPVIPLNLIPQVNPIFEKCDKMFSLNGYLMRSGIYSKFEFNYQPLANQITTYWQEIEYPSDYYYKGGTNTSYMRDEQYAFFIRWLYNDGDKSASYHIPGRASFPTDLFRLPGNPDTLYPDQDYYWQVYNTATITSNNLNQVLPDGGIVTKEGLMGYWESTEKYPINRPEVWGELCGIPIRHHKFPDSCTSHIHNQGGDKIYMLGVRFDNIKHPLDNNGNPIENIIGYEILRGTREGNRTVIAKGLLNNMRQYSNTDNRKVLYQNYPYNDLRIDKFLRTSFALNQGESPDNEGSGLSEYKNDYFSFHSPETNFANPFLGYDEVKIYTREYGDATGKFEYPYGHPKHKLITNASYLIALTVGTSLAIKNGIGGRGSITKTADDVTQAVAATAIATNFGLGLPPVNANASAALLAGVGNMPLAFSNGAYGGFVGGTSTGYHSGAWTGMSFPTIVNAGGELSGLDFRTLVPGYQTKVGQAIADAAMYLLLISTIDYFAGKGTEEALRIIYALLPYKQYALQYNSHGFYSKYKKVCPDTDLGSTRRKHDNSIYIRDQVQSFDVDYVINNLYRNNYVATKIFGTFPAVSANDSSIEDQSRKRVSDTTIGLNDPVNKSITTKTSAYYVGLKVDLQNQYGQLESITQIPMNTCYFLTSSRIKNKLYNSGTMFGGDIYINRYTEKNPFMFFNTWLFDVPDGTEIDYKQYANVLYPRYWANFDKMDGSAIQTPLSWSSLTSGNLLGFITAASAYHHLDRNTSATNSFQITSAWFYLFYNGVRDFFVESEINLAFRDYGELDSQRHYDRTDFTDTSRLFRTDIIKTGNYYKYDFSLSVSKLLSNYVGFGKILPRSYDPNVAETCFTYNRSKVYYSLPQISEQARDSWRIYLPNNYKDFENTISSIKPINRTGGLILFEDAEPTSFTGVDQLQTGAGTKITIGDGGLFAQPFQSLVNADDEFEYASCQDTKSVVNTPYGTFWMSRNSGKVLWYYGGSISDIAMNGMRYWFIQHLPNVLTTQYPNFPHVENTVVGIGCQTVYDTQYEIVYFCKRDFKAKSTAVKYDEQQDYFYVNRQSGLLRIELGDPEYFEDCSWTISYDPKTKMWISFHDWHPNHVLGTNDHFYTVNGNTFWKHNDTCNSFCNFYGRNYAFEVEMPVNTGVNINTIKSVEYYLEVLNYSQDCIDPYHVLDANFDYAMVYNTEQNSGLLKLNLKPYSPSEMLNYPKITPNGIEIMFSKEENKYRFNQFWDATKDRGEFSGIQYRMFNTEQNGYRKVLNPTYIDYNKSPLERKKFRHYGNRLILGKTVSDNLKYNLKVTAVKETLSPR
jgi:hypothetical protein